MKNYVIITLVCFLVSFSGISGTGNWIKDYKLNQLSENSSYYIYESLHSGQDLRDHLKQEGYVFLEYTRKNKSDLSVTQFQNAWKVELSFTYYDQLGVLQTGMLEIKNKPDGSSGGDEFVFLDYSKIDVITGSEGYDITISSIVASYFINSNWVIETDLTNSTHIPVSDIDFRLELRNISLYHLDVAGSESELPGFAPTSFNFPRIQWSYLTGAEEYDLEWVFIDSESNESDLIENTNIPTFFEVPFLLKESSRVRTWRTHHVLDKTYPTGKIYFRVRAVSQFVENNTLIDQVRLGEWSYFMVPADFLNGAIDPSNILLYDVTPSLAFERQKNWLYGVAYAENGKSVSSVTFYDGSNRGRQSLTYNTSDDVTLVGESKYDYEGRQTISVIPAPVLGRTFGYKVNFNMSGAGDVFDEDNYDFGDLSTNPQPLAATSGAAKYFSPNNDFSNDLFRAAIPNAEGYVYSQTIYRNDGSGRIERVGGIGSDFQVNTDQSIRTYYGSPFLFELKRLFGNNVSDDLNGYRKEIVRDANGQHSVTYYDKRGNVIATGLTGASPNNLIALESDGEVTVVTSLNDNNVQTDPYTLVSEHTFINTIPNQQISLDYDLQGHLNSFPSQTVDVEGINIEFPGFCSTCRYNLTIRVIKPNGIDLFNTTYPDIAYSAEGCGIALEQEFIGPIPLLFGEIGEYRIIKTLTVDVAAMEDAFQQTLASSDIPTEEEFVNDYLVNVDLSGCFETCEDYCMGKWVFEYKEINPSISTVNAIAAWNALPEIDKETYVQACVNLPNSGCNLEELTDEILDSQFLVDENAGEDSYSNICEQKRQLMLDQLMPGAVEYNRLIDEDVAVLLTINGTDYTLEEVRDNATLSASFTRLHAQLLLMHHREFCHLEYCNNWSFSQAYSVKLTTKMNNTAWSATVPLFVQPYNTTIGLGGTMYTSDPFIMQPANIWAGTTSGQFNLQYRITNYLALYGLSQQAFVAAYYGGLAPPPQCMIPNTGSLANYIDILIDCATSWGSYSAAEINQMKVNAFKGMYDQLKEEILREYKLAGMNNNSICEYYHDDNAVFMGAMTQEEMEDAIAIQMQDFSMAQPTCEELAYQSTVQWVGSLTVDCASDLNAIYCVGTIPYDYICDPNFGAISLQQAYSLDPNPGSTAPIYDLFYAFVMNTCPENTYGLFYNPDPDNSIPSAPGELQYVKIRDILLSTCGLDGNNADGTDTDGLLSFEVETITTITIPNMDALVEAPSSVCLDELVAFINVGFQNAEPIPTTSVSQYPLYTFSLANITTLLSGCDYLPGVSSDYPNTTLLYNGVDVNRPGNYQFSLISDPIGHGGCELIRFTFPGGVGGVPSISSISSPVYYGVSSSSSFFVYSVVITYSNSTTATGYISIRPNCSPIIQQVDYTYSEINSIDLNLPYNYQADCFESELNQAEVDAQQAYQNYINGLYNQFLAGIDCIHKEKENFKMTYNLNEYQYTLYYYDLAGNLVQTVPPQGVDILTQAEVDADLNPIHRMETRYEYNGLNTLISQFTPDGGQAKYYLDELYRVRYSQNARQLIEDKASYSQYDELGRVVQAGELKLLVGTDLAASTELQLPLGATVLDFTKSFYEDGYNDPSIVSQFSNSTQDNLRNAIGAVYHRQGDYTTSGDLIPGTLFESVISYSYDPHKNVKEMVTTNYHLASINQAHKRINYSYDLISGNVKEVVYQKDALDEFRHRYHYDANNRLIRAFTSHDGVFWEMEAKYFYYLHGSLARTEIGHDKVQGLDYAYNLQGWLKGVNSSTLISSRDIGKDANLAGLNKNFAIDAVGFNLSYFDNDYSSIGSLSAFANTSSVADYNLHPVTNTNAPRNLYNGNISNMVTAMRNTNEETIDVLSNNYRYDQLQRIKEMDVFSSADLMSSNTFNTPLLYRGGAYQTRYSFDKNGNLTTLSRNGSGLNDAGTAPNNLAMDNFTYHYYDEFTGNTTVVIPNETNRLSRVQDIAPENYTTDIKQNQTNNNYQYDASGQLISDEQEGIEEIIWTVTGKVKEMRFTNASNKKDLKFLYDPMDMRIAKIVYQNDAHTKLDIEYYSHDAQGNPMATYKRKIQLTSSSGNSHTYFEEFILGEQMIYGSSRLGVKNSQLTLMEFDLVQTQTAPSNIDYDIQTVRSPITIVYPDFSRRLVGIKFYELSNHLGNVLTVITDRKTQFTDNGNSVYAPDVVSYSDYYPYGMLLPNRHGSAAEGYRYGFQGQESDDEIKGEGNSVNYKYRMHDPRVGRFFAIDPLAPKYPWYTPYQFSGNKVIAMVELEGLEETKSQSKSLSEVTQAESKENPIIVAPRQYWGNKSEQDYGNAYESEGVSGRLWRENGAWIFMSSTPTESDGPQQQIQIYDEVGKKWLYAQEEGLLSYLENNNGGNYIHTPAEHVLVGQAKDAFNSGQNITANQRDAIRRYDAGLPTDWEHTAIWYAAYGMDENAARVHEYLGASTTLIAFGAGGFGAKGCPSTRVSQVKSNMSTNMSMKVSQFNVQNPNSFRGAKSNSVESFLKSNGWSGSKTNPNRVYTDGMRYTNGVRGQQIRIMSGGSTRSIPEKTGPYMEISINGTKTVVPLSGNPTLK